MHVKLIGQQIQAANISHSFTKMLINKVVNKFKRYKDSKGHLQILFACGSGTNSELGIRRKVTDVPEARSLRKRTKGK